MSDYDSPPLSPGSAGSLSSGGLRTPPNLYQNSADPSATWLVQKYGGTSVGKFAVKIAQDIIPTYLEQHKVAIVCSARSGSTKALGTTNLLLRAATEALQRNTALPNSSTAGLATPQMTTPLISGIAHNKGFWSRHRSLSNGPGMNGVGSSSRQSTRDTPARSHSPPLSPAAVLSSLSEIPSPFSSQAGNGVGNTVNDVALPAFHLTIDLLRADHISAARASVRDPELLRELEDEIERDCEGLRSFLQAAQIIDEISPRSRDSIVGVGERLSCKLVAAVLRDHGIDSEFVSLENIVAAMGETEVESRGTGSLDQAFYDKLAMTVGERIKQCGQRVPVVTGFFGAVPGSLLRQVGRGYTDLLAALTAVGLSASELQIWKEVDGIFTADPRKVPTARLIPIISPDEAAELTYYGSEVVHPFTMEQVIRRKIPIRIKNVENPMGGGTVIIPEPDSDDSEDGSRASPLLNTYTGDSDTFSLARTTRSPTAVTIKDRIIVLNVHSNRKSVSHGFFAGIFSALDKFGVVVDLISTSEVHVSMAIEDSLGKRMVDKIIKELEKSGTVTLHNDMAILSLVGKQMRNMVGIAGRMFTTLADGNVNIEMISQGASEINISCVIDGKDAVKALNIIHQSCLQINAEGITKRMGPWLF